jgi:hypothetical protein
MDKKLSIKGLVAPLPLFQSLHFPLSSRSAPPAPVAPLPLLQSLHSLCSCRSAPHLQSLRSCYPCSSLSAPPVPIAFQLDDFFFQPDNFFSTRQLFLNLTTFLQFNNFFFKLTTFFHFLLQLKLQRTMVLPALRDPCLLFVGTDKNF